MNPQMKYEIGQTLKHLVSGEHGICKGRSEYAKELGEPSYFVSIKNAQGHAERVWWPESEVTAI